jgi:hypothetical protein
MANENADKHDSFLPVEAIEMTWEEIETAVSTEADSAIRYCRDTLSPGRIEKWDRYYGRPLGNEVKGRSKYMSRDLLETIEWIMPTLIKTLASGDSKIKLDIEGQPTWVGPALMRKIYDDLSADAQGSMFTVFYQWFKDALVSGSAYAKVFWEVEYEEKDHQIPAVSLDQYSQLEADEDIEINKASYMPGGYSDVQMTIRQLRRDQLVTENIPTWEFVTSKRTRSMNDEHAKGHITYVTMDYLKRINKAMTEHDDEPYFIYLDEVEQNASKQTGEQEDMVNTLSAEKQSFMGYELYGDQYEDGEAATGLKARVQLEEWYTRLDVKGTGYLRDIICWRANGRLIRYQDNDDGFIPIASLSPIIDCYKFNGMSYADLVIELQTLKTVLFRRVLDNFDWQNLGRWFKQPGAQVDIKALLDGVPGDVVEVDLNAVRNETPTPFHPQNLALFDYIDGVKEQRTGSTKYTQGTDSNTLNKTASGIQMIQSAAMQRIELIARIFAEGLKDYYQKSAMLYQRNMRKSFMAKVNGEDVEITPDMIQGKVLARVNMGVEAQIGMAETQRLERMAGTLQGFNKMAPGLFGAEQVHNIAAKYITAMGYIATEDFISPLKQHLAESQQMTQMQQQMQQMQVQMEQAKLKIEQMGTNLEASKVQGDHQVDLAKIELDRETSENEVLQKEKDSKRDYALGLAKLEVDRGKDKVKDKSKKALPGRAKGGPVTAGQPYMVGEEGQEVFVPEESGYIIPNSAINPTEPLSANTVPKEAVFSEVEKEIETNKFDKFYGDTTYNKCNQFVACAANKWGIELPKNKDIPDYLAENKSSSGGVYGESPELPMTATPLRFYFEERADIKDSGATAVKADEAKDLANKNELVLMLGKGHATIVAPSETGNIQVYRSDRSLRGDDKRIKVGVKDPESWQFYHIQKDKYDKFNQEMKKMGATDKDINSINLHNSDSKLRKLIVKFGKVGRE